MRKRGQNGTDLVADVGGGHEVDQDGFRIETDFAAVSTLAGFCREEISTESSNNADWRFAISGSIETTLGLRTAQTVSASRRAARPASLRKYVR
jgi:hypothetical protein